MLLLSEVLRDNYEKYGQELQEGPALLQHHRKSHGQVLRRRDEASRGQFHQAKTDTLAQGFDQEFLSRLLDPYHQKLHLRPVQGTPIVSHQLWNSYFDLYRIFNP